MTRVAIIGANGHVASEICLLLRNHPWIELVPICRNPTGSAFLRYRGIPCRHGHVTDPHEAPRLLGDCDVVLNFALPVGQPRHTREANRRIIENSVRYSPQGATIVYFSTQCVHRSFRPSGSLPWRNAYGAEKFRSERLVRRSARDARKVFILRLGHVSGELQNLTCRLREMIQAGAVPVPEGGAFDSNVIHTVTIVDAIIRILRRLEKPDTYDLVNVPQWTWRRVLEHDADAIGCDLTLAPAGGGTGSVPGRGSLDLLAGAARATVSAPAARETGLRVLARLSEDMNERAQAQHFRRRATAEAAAVRPPRPVEPLAAFAFGPGGTDFLRSLSPTEDLLAAPTAQIAERDAEAAFPPDLLPAGS